MIGIISDTHDNVPEIKRAVEILKSKKLEFVIHLGDVVAPITARLFSGLKMKFIKGNCDGDVEGIKRVAESIGGEFLGDIGELRIGGKGFALYHGGSKERLDKLIDSQKYDYVLHGHTHRRRNEKIGKTRIISPGNLYPGHLDHGFALLDIKEDKVEFVEIK